MMSFMAFHLSSSVRADNAQDAQNIRDAIVARIRAARHDLRISQQDIEDRAASGPASTAGIAQAVDTGLRSVVWRTDR